MSPIATAFCIIGIIVALGAYFTLAAVFGVIHDAAEAENKLLEGER